VAHETLRDRACAMTQMRAIWHCEIFDTTPAIIDAAIPKCPETLKWLCSS